jgi:hypothetical protein
MVNKFCKFLNGVLESTMQVASMIREDIVQTKRATVEREYSPSELGRLFSM